MEVIEKKEITEENFILNDANITRQNADFFIKNNLLLFIEPYYLHEKNKENMKVDKFLGAFTLTVWRYYERPFKHHVRYGQELISIYKLFNGEYCLIYSNEYISNKKTHQYYFFDNYEKLMINIYENYELPNGKTFFFEKYPQKIIDLIQKTNLLNGNGSDTSKPRQLWTY